MDEFPPGETIGSGATIVGRDEAGEEISFTVTDNRDAVARLDANHPLAGQTLVFEIEIQGIRDASGKEFSRGEVLE